MYEGPIQDLIDELSRLPGIGPRGASRIAFYLLDAPEEDVFALADTLRRVKESSRVCEGCFNVSQEERCRICRDPRRDRSQLCVVEESKDVVAIERTNAEHAPWYVVPANEKWYARAAVQHIAITELEQMGVAWPGGDFDVEAERKRLKATKDMRWP